MLRSSWILNKRNLSYKIVKNCRIIGLNRQGKITGTGIELFSSELMYKNTDKRYILKTGLHTTRFVAKIYL